MEGVYDIISKNFLVQNFWLISLKKSLLSWEVFLHHSKFWFHKISLHSFQKCTQALKNLHFESRTILTTTLHWQDIIARDRRLKKGYPKFLRFHFFHQNLKIWTRIDLLLKERQLLKIECCFALRSFYNTPLLWKILASIQNFSFRFSLSEN